MKPKIALVTGAAGIVGPGICRALTEAGWVVAAHALDASDWDVVEKIEGTPFPAALKVEADLAGRGECLRLVTTVQRELGPVSLLVNNAAANPGPLPALDAITADYAEMMVRVNLLAPLFLIQACLDDLKGADGGSIVNVSSIQAEFPWPNQLLYPAAKAGLESLTSTLARDLAPWKIRSNVVRIGSVPGPAFMWEELKKLSAEDARRLYGEVLPEHLKNSTFLNPQGQVIRPAEVGEVIAFLASPAARNINGTTIPLDGGLGCAMTMPPRTTPWNPKAAVEEWMKKNFSE